MAGWLAGWLVPSGYGVRNTEGGNERDELPPPRVEEDEGDREAGREGQGGEGKDWLVS